MMEKLYILCVEDQPEVLETVVNQLAVFQDYAIIEECDSGDEAIELMDEIDGDGHHVALIISDHVMPGLSGVEFLAKVAQDDRFTHTKKVLLTGQVTHVDTIQAINLARIDQYLSKPWQRDELINSTKILLTEFLFAKGLAYQPFQSVLDKQRLFELMLGAL